jgi:hypothetical protein
MLIRNLSVLAYAQGFTHWLYRTDVPIPVDPVQTWNHDNYFNNAKDLFKVGDLVTVSYNVPRESKYVSGARIVQIAIDENNPDVVVVKV